MGWTKIQTKEKTAAETSITMDSVSSLGKYAFAKGEEVVSCEGTWTAKAATPASTIVTDPDLNVSGNYYFTGSIGGESLKRIGFAYDPEYPQYTGIVVQTDSISRLTKLSTSSPWTLTGGTDINNADFYAFLVKYFNKTV